MATAERTLAAVSLVRAGDGNATGQSATHRIRRREKKPDLETPLPGKACVLSGDLPTASFAIDHGNSNGCPARRAYRKLLRNTGKRRTEIQNTLEIAKTIEFELLAVRSRNGASRCERPTLTTIESPDAFMPRISYASPDARLRWNFVSVISGRLERSASERRKAGETFWHRELPLQHALSGPGVRRWFTTENFISDPGRMDRQYCVTAPTCRRRDIVGDRTTAD